MQRNIRVLVVEPNKLPKDMMIKNTLKTKQDIVGGYIEDAYLLNDDRVVLICNEEGKCNGLELNRDIGHDIIAGTFIIAGDNPETGEYISLDDEQVDKYKKVFNERSIQETRLKVLRLMTEKQNNSVYEI